MNITQLRIIFYNGAEYKMRLYSKAFAILILFLFITSTLGVISKNQDLSEKNINYIPHNPININGNNDFTTSHGVTSGNGIKDDPYISQRHK